MDTKNNNQRGELITALNKIAARQLTQTQAHQFDNFIANAMHFYPDADYLARPAQDIFWNLWGLCRFSAEQVDATSTENRARVRVFNPDPDRDGWSSALLGGFATHCAQSSRIKYFYLAE
jgi:glutamate dehydrogenase